jgi:flagellar basal body rod protein FlgG
MHGLELRYEATAHNLANLETSGHKRLIVRTTRSSDNSFAAQLDSAKTAESSVVRDFTQGDVVTTDDPGELALQGEGFFAVELDGQVRYERALRVHVEPDGTLGDDRGARVLGEAGPIRLAAPTSKMQVERDGSVREIDGPVAGKVRVVTFVDPQKLEESTGGVYRAPDDAEVVVAQETHVVQGARERSNSDAIGELVNLIAAQRQYEAAQRTLVAENQIRERLNQIGS